MHTSYRILLLGPLSTSMLASTLPERPLEDLSKAAIRKRLPPLAKSGEWRSRLPNVPNIRTSQPNIREKDPIFDASHHQQLPDSIADSPEAKDLPPCMQSKSPICRAFHYIQETNGFQKFKDIYEVYDNVREVAMSDISGETNWTCLPSNLPAPPMNATTAYIKAAAGTANLNSVYLNELRADSPACFFALLERRYAYALQMILAETIRVCTVSSQSSKRDAPPTYIETVNRRSHQQRRQDEETIFSTQLNVDVREVFGPPVGDYPEFQLHTCSYFGGTLEVDVAYYL